MKMRSLKGKVVDFAYYIENHAETPALGNAMLNARGDQLDEKGRIVKTRQEISQEYHRSTKSVKQVSIKALDDEMFATPAEAVKRLEDKAAAKKAEAKSEPTKRKLSDAE